MMITDKDLYDAEIKKINSGRKEILNRASIDSYVKKGLVGQMQSIYPIVAIIALAVLVISIIVKQYTFTLFAAVAIIGSIAGFSFFKQYNNQINSNNFYIEKRRVMSKEIKHYSHHERTGTLYYLKFAGLVHNKRVSVSDIEYSIANPGDWYYIVFVGSKKSAFHAYPANRYELGEDLIPFLYEDNTNTN